MADKKSPPPIVRADPEQYTLPFWPEHLRGLPTAALYSALFAPVRRGARAAVQREEIEAVGEFKIILTGFRLDQGDLDVLQQLLHLARQTPPGQVIQFRQRDFLRALGRDTGKSQRTWLLRSLSRLKACDIEIAKGPKAFAGSFIAEHGRDDDTGMHFVVLDRAIGKLFLQGYQQIRWDARQRLAGQPLAQWLLGWVAGQRTPLTWMTTELQRYAGSSYGRLRDFRAALEEAAERVRSAGVNVWLEWSPKGERCTVHVSARPQLTGT
jgi:hypothetical protein